MGSPEELFSEGADKAYCAICCVFRSNRKELYTIVSTVPPLQCDGSVNPIKSNAVKRWLDDLDILPTTGIT